MQSVTFPQGDRHVSTPLSKLLLLTNSLGSLVLSRMQFLSVLPRYEFKSHIQKPDNNPEPFAQRKIIISNIYTCEHNVMHKVSKDVIT